MQNKWMRLLLPLLILAGAAAIALLMIKSRPELPRREAVASIPVVEVMAVEPGPVRDHCALARYCGGANGYRAGLRGVGQDYLGGAGIAGG